MADCCKTDLVPLVHTYRGKRESQRFVAVICQGCGEALIREGSLTSDQWPPFHAVTLDDYKQLREDDKARLVRATLEPIRASVLMDKATLSD
jgi:hypothetical protein